MFIKKKKKKQTNKQNLAIPLLNEVSKNFLSTPFPPFDYMEYNFIKVET